MSNLLRPHRGVVLVFTAGILAILAALGMSFYAITQSSTMSSVRYSDMVRADLLTRAGLNDAIARLREQAFSKTEDPSDPWFMVNYLDGLKSRFSFIEKDTTTSKPLPYSRALGSSALENGDRYTLQICDAASKVNINAGDNLAVILDNLCRVIGEPLKAADQAALQPRVWGTHGAPAASYSTTQNADDLADTRDLHYRLGTDGRPLVDGNGRAICGDGYAIAGYRARNGRFGSVAEIRQALTFVDRNGNGILDDPLEQFEVEAKFAAVRDYITTDSWIDTTTVGVGKFEWVTTVNLEDVCVPRASGTDTDPLTGTTVNVYDLQDVDSDSIEYQILIDRDKSWIADDPVGDPLNQRGSLRGSYVSIMNNHGAGQLRRIATNGADWIAIRGYDPDERMTVPPGPISSYLIMAREDAKLELVPNTTTYVPRVRKDGTFPDDPVIDYANRPLCIHRSPVNINTASDKVLAALFMGINVQHGHPMAVGTDAEWPNVVPYPYPDPPADATSTVWKTKDYADRSLEAFLLTLKGLKRVPSDSGKVVFDRSRPAQATTPQFDYLDNNGVLANLNAAQELAHRVIVARQSTDWDGNALAADPYVAAYPRGPFKSWDDFYSRIVKPWDDARNAATKVSVARMIMANFNNNTDILKFNPNIEWIDRYGRNFTEMEPVMVYADGANEPTWVPFVLNAGTSDGMWNTTLVNNLSKTKGSYITRSLRYKSDDLIDKTDLNRSTTEFAMDSGGIYEVVSTGQVFGPTGLLAERKMETLIKVYDVWRESTQDQFVRGYISQASNGTGSVTDPNRSGRIVRDARNTTAPFKRLALDTWPEPLVPLGYVIPAGAAGWDADMVSTEHYDAWQNQKSSRRIPDVVSNRILPARYDGQIALATNTSKYDNAGENDSFLASFDGDLDTGTCKGNGREAAKSPDNYKIRTLDTISLLGLLNDTQVDFDPAPKDVFVVAGANTAMNALDPAKFWHNVTCRMGDLRPEGVYMGNVGASGRDAALKYRTYYNWPLGWLPDNKSQMLYRMWMKPNWHLDDGQEHEFFNGCNTGAGYEATGMIFSKPGKFSGAMRRQSPGSSDSSAGGGGSEENDLKLHAEDKNDQDMLSWIHGGTSNVPFTSTLATSPTKYKESPAYRIQPFRWTHIGFAVNYYYTITNDPTVITEVPTNLTWNSSGFYDTGYSMRGRWRYGGGLDPMNEEVNTKRIRVFVDSQRDPMGATWSPRYYYEKINRKTMANTDLGNDTNNPQMAAWSWAQRSSTEADKTIFGMNNLNRALDKWLYRSCSLDGTQAVVDEMKISVTNQSLTTDVWGDNRVETEMTTSRYYLSSNPAVTAEQPTFTSQTLLSSLRGSNSTSGEEVTVVRVSWNCFTPRFMHENKTHQNARTRVEVIGDRGGAPPNNSSTVQPQVLTNQSYRGPFDYIQYNHEILPAATSLDPRPGEASLGGNALVTVGGVNALYCDRPALKDYPVVAGMQQAHATKGIEVELLRDTDGTPDNGDEVILDGKTFTNPDGTFINPDPAKPRVNTLGSAVNPVKVNSGQLRYRVRFKYPIDYFVQQVYGMADATVDPSKHYMVDTPVFDDISVTYFTKTRILVYREVTE